MAKRKRAANASPVRKRKTARRKANPTRTYRAGARRAPNRAVTPYKRRTTARKNPLIIYRTSKRKNPHGNEVLEFVVAGIGIGSLQPWLSSMASRFGVPGQWITPVSTAATGIGLSYLFGMFRQTKRFAQPAFVLGISTAVVAVLAPIVRRWMMPSMAAAPQANGPAGRRYANGPNGIGIWSGKPSALPQPRQVAVAANKQAGPQGIGIFSKPAGRFR